MRATIGCMTYYGAKEIAASFRTVRNNTLKVAEDIPEEKYSFRPAEGSRTVAQTLIHISNVPQVRAGDPSRQRAVHHGGL